MRRTRVRGRQAIGLSTSVLLVAILGTSCTGANESDESSTGQGETPSATQSPGSITDAPTGVTESPNSSDPGVVETEVPPDESSSGGSAGTQAFAVESMAGVDRGCADVDAPKAFRSGDLGADFGPFLSATPSTPKAPILVVPKRVAKSGSATLVMTSESGETRRASTRALEVAGDVAYFPVLVRTNLTGRWEIKASVGDQSGCFIVSR